MSSADQEANPAPTPLDAEREQLRKAGFTEAEVSQILITRASQQPAPAGQGVMSNVLSSIVAVASHARVLIPTFRKDVTTVFDGTAPASARAGATASLLVKAIVVMVLGYAAWQEWNQHIISATEIAQQQARKAEAEAITAKQDAWRQCIWGLKDPLEDEACDKLALDPQERTRQRAERKEEIARNAQRCKPDENYVMGACRPIVSDK
jgi:hypothetical protein